MPELVNWRDPESRHYSDVTNHRLCPGGTQYLRYLWVRSQIPYRSRVLDIGCNCGQLAMNLLQDRASQVTGIDIVEEFILNNRETKAEWAEQWIHADFCDMSLVDIHRLGSFDVVTALEIIEHPIDLYKFRRNAVFALRQGGRLIITTPHPDSPGGYEFMWKHAYHVRQWTRQRLLDVFGPMETYTEISYPLETGLHLGEMGAVFVKT